MTLSSNQDKIDEKLVLDSPSSTSWNLFRRIVLAILLGSAAITLIKVAFFPSSNQTPPLVFPDNIPIPEWELEKSSETGINSQISQPEVNKLFGFVNGKSYQYRQGKKVLKIDMRYFAPSVGDVSAYFGHYNNMTLIPASLIIREKTNIGYYGLFTNNQQTHLTTCLTPRGGNIFKREQFFQVRYSSDLRVERFLPWAIGRSPLLDNRCLWIYMSLTGTDKNASSSDYSALEKLWLSWNKWWQPQFEKSHL